MIERKGTDHERINPVRSMRETGAGAVKTGSAAGKAGAKRTARENDRQTWKKWSVKWFSPDSLMGKVLCILLVIILTVGAFLAPKVINNLYDAGSLMQITYVDMELTPYAVTYADFEDKLRAIARANTAGEQFVTLPAEETEQKVDDAELIAAVNREMLAAGDGISLLFYEGWWSGLSEENLISREKNTLYMQPQGNGADNHAYRENAPIQFWTLTFEVTDRQREESLGIVADDLENWMAEEKIVFEEEKKQLLESAYATDRLMVCMDTDFYKIYAVALEGDEQRISDFYGMALPELFRVAPESGKKQAVLEYTDAQMFVTDGLIDGFVEYWEITPENKGIYMDIPGELSGCVAFRDDAADTGTTAEEDAQKEAAVSAGTAYEIVSDGVMIVESSDGDMYGGADDMAGNEILLEAGCQGIFEDNDGSGLWIQKMGCRHFFDMMAF